MNIEQIQSLSDKELTSLVGKDCGWEHKPCTCMGCDSKGPYRYERYRNDVQVERSDELPKYPSDLNAMHEAEKMLSPEQWKDYVENLNRLLVYPVHASARDRAEAFAITMTKVEG